MGARVAAWPDYADYQRKTDRQIPVFVLTPIPDSAQVVAPLFGVRRTGAEPSNVAAVRG